MFKCPICGEEEFNFLYKNALSFPSAKTLDHHLMRRHDLMMLQDFETLYAEGWEQRILDAYAMLLIGRTGA